MRSRGIELLQFHIDKDKKARLKTIIEASGMTIRGWMNAQIDRVLEKKSKTQEVNKQ